MDLAKGRDGAWRLASAIWNSDLVEQDSAPAASRSSYFIERGRITLLGKAAYVLAFGVTVLALVLLTPWIVELATTR